MPSVVYICFILYPRMPGARFSFDSELLNMYILEMGHKSEYSVNEHFTYTLPLQS